jgi:hypothetical protein
MFKPHEDYDFENNDRVFIENSDGTLAYFLLVYEQETAMWVLVPYTDKNFDTPKPNSDGLVIAEPLHAFGYDMIERMEGYEFDELD